MFKVKNIPEVMVDHLPYCHSKDRVKTPNIYECKRIDCDIRKNCGFVESHHFIARK